MTKHYDPWVYFEVGWFTDHLDHIQQMAREGNEEAAWLLILWRLYRWVPSQGLDEWAADIRAYRQSH